MKSFSIVIFYLLIKAVSGQDYQHIITPGNTFYTDGTYNTGCLVGVNIDSILPGVNGDTLFLAGNTIRQFPGDSLFDTIGGILGRAIWKLTSGDYYFFNRDGDTILLRSQASLNEQWKFCNLPDQGYLQATCSSIYDTSLPGTTETVKRITLQAIDSNGLPVLNYYNGQNILLGRKYGFLKIFDLYIIPKISGKHNLVGRNDPEIGFQGLSWREVYNYDVGDVFHYIGRYNVIVTSHHTRNNFKLIRKVLAKMVSPGQDSVTYTFEFCKQVIGLGFFPYYEFVHDTVDIVYPFNDNLNDPSINWLPEQFTATSFRYYTTLNTNIPGKAASGRKGGYYSCCWKLADTNFITLESEFAPGLGQTLERKLWRPFFNYWDHDFQLLVYFKKGNQTWGEPVYTDCTFMSVEDTQPKNIIKLIISPNPVKSVATILISGSNQRETYLLTISDITGRDVFCTAIESNSYQFNRGNLPPGLYILQVSSVRNTICYQAKMVLE